VGCGGVGGGGGGGSKGGGDIYDYFKKDGKKVKADFGFHRSKMKNYKGGRYETSGDAVASNDDSNAGDWSDFGNRRNLVSRGRLRAGLFSDEEDLSSENENGRQEKEEKSKAEEPVKEDTSAGDTKADKGNTSEADKEGNDDNAEPLTNEQIDRQLKANLQKQKQKFDGDAQKIEDAVNNNKQDDAENMKNSEELAFGEYKDIGSEHQGLRYDPSHYQEQDEEEAMLAALNDRQFIRYGMGI